MTIENLSLDETNWLFQLYAEICKREGSAPSMKGFTIYLEELE